MKKCKKVLLITLYDENNIGNRLQNYALQHILELYVEKVITLDNGYTTKPSIFNFIVIVIKGILGVFGKKIYFEEYKKYLADKRRRNANKKFDKLNMSNVLKITNEKAFKRDWSEYDIAVAGSDQIWHKWREDKLELPFYYLEFLPDYKRNAYAASFGREELPLEDLKQHIIGLKGMRYISCREENGCRIIYNNIGREVPRTLDPTLLLGPSEWRKISSQASRYAKKQNKYIFIYFLGEITDEYREFIEMKKLSLGITNIIDFSNRKNAKICKCGPSDFLKLIDQADYVFTDSFHCTVFSVIFEKKFTSFRRKQNGFEHMFDRIEDLLSSVGMLENIFDGTDRHATNDFNILRDNSLKYINFILNKDIGKYE